MINPRFLRLLLSVLLASISGCASRSVLLVHPQSGSTMKCGAAGVGIMAGAAEGFVEECLKRYESQGYVAMENLTPQQRADLEKRGLLPKPEPPTFRYGY
ncbi:MAG: hypothetical protein HYY45_21220 [Deltaproteobacteria bacterium]|nr:hypothetical protein [Deltaproteobacteria bacterium]